MRHIVIVVISLLSALTVCAETWETMFAYNEVSQIAVGVNKVYAVSDGVLFSVNKHSEQIETYNSGNGLHGKNIKSIYYDNDLQMLIIGYLSGKIDLFVDGTIYYVSGLYLKDMTATKTINNITIRDGKAYLSMDFGIVTFDLKKRVLVDTYYIGAKSAEVKVNDIRFIGDSIYAFGDALLYKANMNDNVVDYRNWQTEPLGRIQRDKDKGVRVADTNGEVWEAGGTEGIIRNTLTGERLTYKPDGPLVNTPYHMSVANGRLYVVPGGRWAVQNQTPGCVMVYDGSQWHNISQQTIQAATNGHPAEDFMDVAVDPMDAEHFFVTAYGGGVYEFRNYQVVEQYLPDNSTLVSAGSNEQTYTRCSGGCFDKDGNFWCTNMGDDVLHCYNRNSQWHKIQLQFNNSVFFMATTTCLILDRNKNNLKWIPYARYTPGLVLLDDKGTLSDTDDKMMFRTSWTTATGKEIVPTEIYTAQQDETGDIWMGTSAGVIIIPHTSDYFTSDLCELIDIVEDNGENPFQTLEIRAIEFDDKGQIWIGTRTVGVYVVSADRQSIVAHYTPDNSLMQGSYVMSLAFDHQSKKMYIGTDEGIVSFSEASSSGGTNIDKTGSEEDIDYGLMQQWKLHASYTNMQRVVQTPTRVYALADGALFSVDKQDESIMEWNKSTGLNGNTVSHIAYDTQTKQLIIGYLDGRIDLLSEDGEVVAMLDLFHKANTLSVTINSIFTHNGKAYLSMPFGIVSINIAKAEIEDTYYIGENAEDVDVQFVTILEDSIYAASETDLYVASIRDNLVDYNYWHMRNLPGSHSIQQMCETNGKLCVLQENKLYVANDSQWQCVQDSLEWLSASSPLMAYKTNVGVISIDTDWHHTRISNYGSKDALYDAANRAYWLATPYYGVQRLQNGTQSYKPEGPITNNGYRLKYDNGCLFVAPGGRWAVQSFLIGNMSVYDGEKWHGLPAWDTYMQCGSYPIDIVSCAAAKDATGHFYAASYGRGVYEFKDYKAVKQYGPHNSTLSSAIEDNPDSYTRTDGAMVDENGNLWVLNTGSNAHPIHIMTPQGTWHSLDMYSGGRQIHLTTPWEITVDKRDNRYKWIIDQRYDTKVCLFYDGGTPTDNSDDRCMIRSIFYDQDGLQLAPSTLYCLAQDANNDIWLGTPAGIIIIPSSEDFFTSNTCYRIKIPRNDGTNLADYLLGTEQINCIAVDGANRKWIGTETSGLYLMSADGLTTEAHFTTENSLLPSNAILSIAINPTTGEVFVGTGNGIASYRSDASAPQDDFSNAYAYPNPVRPNYQGVITISGLMENTTVNIVDAGGNLICKTRSNGGIAVWDGKNQQGERASSGVYTVLCNAGDGKNHTVVKILVMN